MNRVSRMMMIANRGNRGNRGGNSGQNNGNGVQNNGGQRMEYRYNDGTQYEYNQSGGYGVENRFRDRRGREHYDNGRYAPQNMGDYDVEGRDRVDWDSGMENRYAGNVYPMRAAHETPRRKIGFSIGGEMERLPNENRSRMMPMQFDRRTADEWVSSMKNSDGSTGPHWSFDQAKQLMQQRKIDCDPVEFYAALNAVFSDFCAVAKKHGVNNVEFFIDLAKAWIDDEDAVPDKAAAYYEYVVKH